MIIKEGIVPNIYNKAIYEIQCEYCYASIYIDDTILKLWLSQGIKLKCECGEWI